MESRRRSGHTRRDRRQADHRNLGHPDLSHDGAARLDDRGDYPRGRGAEPAAGVAVAYWLPHRDTIPRSSIYDPGKSADELEAEDADMMETAQDDAIVAALHAASQPVTEMPQVSSVTIGGPRS